MRLAFRRASAALGTAATLIAIGLGTAAAVSAAPASTTIYRANEIGTPSTTNPPSGTLWIYDSGMNLHALTSAEYFMHDGYNKQVTLNGAVLYRVNIDNNCGGPNDGYNEDDTQALNPTGGDGSQCHPVLHVTDLKAPVNRGTILGRFCDPASRDAADDPLPCPHHLTVTETVSGSGHNLSVGAKDHGTMLEIDYTIKATGELVRVLLPGNVTITRVLIRPGPDPWITGGGEGATVVLNH